MELQVWPEGTVACLQTSPTNVEYNGSLFFNTTFIDTQRTSVPQMTNVVTAVSKLVKVTGSKGMNHRQVKDFNT
jgi:hypothetical protein